MNTKTCSRCKDEHPIADFHKDKGSIDGLSYHCKECARRRSNQYYAKHSKQIKAKRNNYHAEMKNDKKYLTRKRASSLCWFHQNKDKHCPNQARRRGAKRNQTPESAKHDKRIQTLYTLAAKLREVGREVHVDHIIPLQPANPNQKPGLHTFENLRIIPARDNLRKGNR